MGMEALGRLFDVCIGFHPFDIGTAQTGKRVSLKNCSGVTVVFFKGVGTAGDDPTITLQEHSAASSGTSQNLVVIDKYYLKDAASTTLAGTETWTEVTQTAAATIADPGGAGTSAEHEQIVAFYVGADQLSDGFDYISLNCGDVGSNAQLGCALYLRHDLAEQRKPSNLPASLA